MCRPYGTAHNFSNVESLNKKSNSKLHHSHLQQLRSETDFDIRNPEKGASFTCQNVRQMKKILLIMAITTATTLGSEAQSPERTSFADDLEFLRKHTSVVVLERDKAAVVVAPAYQGRVMTSTVDRKKGAGFGWINRPVIETGILPEKERKGRLEEHIHIFGGEERFWLGPEGGQFALYFKPGSKFEFADWVTPAVIDTDAFEIVEQTADRVVFRHSTELINYSGTLFSMGIERTVTLLNREEVEILLGSALPGKISFVGYETDNRLTNTGNDPWVEETGLPSIWMLGMYNPSPGITVVIPFKKGSDEELGPKVNDTYFGKVPPEYLKVEEDVLFFKGDGTLRAKIGISPRRSKGIAGSYDEDSKVLTLVTYNLQEAPSGFVNSMWELQDEPYSGDVINAYNDGSPAPGEPPLGPFYELETSSPAAALSPGGTMKHVQQTLHLQGPEKLLDPLARRLLGVGLEEITDAFE